MARNTAQRQPTPDDVIVEDYGQNMFEDGNNRTERNRKAHDAPIYDKAAHTVSSFPDTNEAEVGDAHQVETAHSRDGTDASGLYDEEGGPLGGIPEQLDSLEAGGTPVDKNPSMKD